MSDFRVRMPRERSGAIKHGHIERNAGPVENARHNGPSRLREQAAQARGDLRVGFPGDFQNMLGGVRLARLRAKIGRAAGGLKHTGQPLIINAPALGMEVEQSLPELRHLGEIRLRL